MTGIPGNGLSLSEASSVVEIGCLLMASGLAGAVGQGETEEGAVFVAIMHPESGEPMFRIGKESGRYVVRGRRGNRLADGRTLRAVSQRAIAANDQNVATLKLVTPLH